MPRDSTDTDSTDTSAPDAVRELLDATLARAERLTGDPLQQVLVVVGRYAELLEEGGTPPEGFLEMTEGSIPLWRERIGRKLREALEIHPSRLPVDPESLADLLAVILLGAVPPSGSPAGSEVGGERLRHFCTYLQLLFDMAE